MKITAFKTSLFLLALQIVLPLAAQSGSDWQPTGEWPFLNKNFRASTVYTGIFKRSKTIVPCNIHVGKQALWYSQNDTLMEAEPGSVLRVEFPNGDVYMPVGSENMFGRIVREDSIDGRIARIIHVRTLDQKALDQKYLDHINKSQNVLQGANLSSIADTEGARRIEQEPLPLTDVFFFQVRGEIFQASRMNILERIDKKRRKEYRTFTRTAEIISSNESSMHKIWEEFFLK